MYNLAENALEKKWKTYFGTSPSTSMPTGKLRDTNVITNKRLYYFYYVSLVESVVLFSLYYNNKLFTVFKVSVSYLPTTNSVSDPLKIDQLKGQAPEGHAYVDSMGNSYMQCAV